MVGITVTTNPVVRLSVSYFCLFVPADIVENEFFSGGLLTAVEPDKNSRQNKHDSLLERIAQTKEERLKRVEENEANRQKLKDADSEWADKVRFMLAKLSKLKPKVRLLNNYLLAVLCIPALSYKFPYPPV